MQALRELQGEVEAGALAIDRRDTVESLMRRYLQDEVRYRLRTGSLRQSTAESYERLARNHITPRLGHLRLSDLMPLAIQSAYDEMLREGLSPGTIQKVHGVLRSACDTAVKNGALKANVATRVRTPSIPRTEAPHLTLDQVRDLAEATEGHRDHALWLSMAYAGLRLGEVLALRWENVDLEARGRVPLSGGSSRDRS